MTTEALTWIAADYHMPATYSIRVPTSSMSSALAMPAPGPATVQLALIKTSIELYGLPYTRNNAFPLIRSLEVRIKPPERVALSTQQIRIYKSDGKGHIIESIAYREYAHAKGPITIYARIQARHSELFKRMLEAIGYWGQADSLACCSRIHHDAPVNEEVAAPLASIGLGPPVAGRFSCFVTEFRDTEVTWQEATSPTSSKRHLVAEAIVKRLYVWPLVTCEQRVGHRVLLRRSLETVQEPSENSGVGASSH